jgi:fatty acid desaturase
MITVGEELAGVDFRPLLEVKSIYFQVKLLILLALCASLIALCMIAPSFLWIAPSILLGLMYAHAVELQHQCLHNTAFKERAWNRRIGVPLGLPLFVSFSDYQNSHMLHHKLLGTPEDKEFFNYGYESLTDIRALIPHLFMVRHYRDVAGFIARAMIGKTTRPEAAPRIARRIRNEYILMGLFMLAMIAITVAFQTPIFLKLWLVPFLIGVPAHALIELPEHIGCNIRSTDVSANTRTIKASWLGVWFTDGNNYHVEHHWLPGIPNHNFAAVHQYVKSQIVTLESSYVSFYWGFVKQLYRHNFQRPANTNTNTKARGAGA